MWGFGSGFRVVESRMIDGGCYSVIFRIGGVGGVVFCCFSVWIVRVKFSFFNKDEVV